MFWGLHHIMGLCTCGSSMTVSVLSGSCLGWGSSRVLAEEQREELGHPLAGTAW